MADLKLEVLLAALDRASGPLKGIGAAGKAAARALQGTQAQLRALDQQSRQLGGLAAQQAKLRALDQQMASTRAQAARLAEQMAGATGADAARLGRQLDQVNGSLGRMDRAAEKLRREMAETDAALRAAGVDTSDLARAQGRLSDETAAATARFRAQERELARLVLRQRQSIDAHRQFQRSMERAAGIRGAGVGAMGLGAAGIATAGIAVKAFADQEDATLRLKMAMMQAGGEVPKTYDAIIAKAKEMGDILPGTTEDFIRMMTMLNRQGLDAQSILSGTAQAAANLAVIFEMAPENAAEFAAKLQDATGTLAKDMPALADTIQRTFYLGVDPGNMLEAYAGLAPAMSAIKMRGLEGAKAMAPLIAMLDQSGLVGGAAGNALAKVFMLPFTKSDAIDETNKALKKAHISALQFTKKGEFAGLDNLFAQFEKLKGFTTEKRVNILSDIFGADKETGQALDAFFQKGRAGYNEALANQQAQAAMQEKIRLLLSGLTNVWGAASGAFTNLLAIMGSLLAPELKQLSDWFGQISSKVSKWVEANPELARTLAQIAALIAIVLVAVGALMVVFSTLGIVLAAARLGFSLLMLGPLGTAVGALAAAFGGLTLPIVLVGAALAAAAAAVWAYWGPISGFFSGFFSGLMEGLAPIAGAFSAAWAPVSAILQPVRDALGWVWDKLLALLPATGQSGAAAEQMGRAWGQVIGAMIARIGDLLLSLSTLPVRILAIGAQMATQFAAIGAQMFAGLKAGIDAAAGATMDYIAGVAARISGAFSSALHMFSPSRVFRGHGINIIAGLVQGLQVATPRALTQVSSLTRGLAIAGAGLALTPLAGSAAPLTAGGGAGGNYGGDTITINISAAPGTDAAGLARHIAQALREHEHQKAARRRSALRDLD